MSALPTFDTVQLQLGLAVIAQDTYILYVDMSGLLIALTWTYNLVKDSKLRTNTQIPTYHIRNN